MDGAHWIGDAAPALRLLMARRGACFVVVPLLALFGALVLQYSVCIGGFGLLLMQQTCSFDFLAIAEFVFRGFALDDNRCCIVGLLANRVASFGIQVSFWHGALVAHVFFVLAFFVSNIGGGWTFSVLC